MIRIIDRITASAMWDVDGTMIRLPYRREFPEPVMVQKIEKYHSVLKSGAYEQDNRELCEAFRFFGGLAFVSIGMACKDEFLSCFAFYAKIFAAIWADGDQGLHSKNIGYEYVFALMLKNEEFPISYDFRYILGETEESELFCQISEQAFSEHWIEKMKPLMAERKSLSNISARVGDVRMSRYFMQIPEETTQYLKRLATGYTARRELISLRKLHFFIFGNDSRTNFIGGDATFFSILKTTVEVELMHQNIIFIGENRREMNSRKDVWVLYQQHGVTLNYMTIDFTKVLKSSMRSELKCFLKQHYSGAIRTADRSYIAMIYAANKLYELNPNVRYFSDVDNTDVKMLQVTMEDESTQANIMSAFAACKALFRYLCSDENESKSPKPLVNPFESISFVNTAKYSKNTPYIPESVIDKINSSIGELNNTDQLVFRIFCETGMRAKEVSFLEADCLEKARYDGAVKLKYIPYKVLKARRRAGIGDYHSVYISTELAALIGQQIQANEELREIHGKSFIFLHHNQGYKVSMYDVSYFIVKINALIKAHNICEKSGGLWHFTSRQCRKTLVVNMIENGATVTELVYQLGHLAGSTVMKYYAEVKAMKLAELNRDFFKIEFDVLLSNEQLSDFTEEELRLLYVDFRLGYRRVELGLCTRKLCDGACKSRSRTVHCVNCPQLCTGMQYLPYWIRLSEVQQGRIDRLIAGYQAESLTDYHDFIEFKQEHKLFTAYQNVITQIRESEVDCQ